MAIDNCPHTFQELARSHLPARMVEMRRAMRQPHSLAEFGQKGIGPKKLCRFFDKTDDCAGCYVLIEKGQPIYVGISRGVCQRVSQHVKGTDHNTASLAYRMAKWEHDHKLTRSQAMKRRPFKVAFEKARGRLARMRIAAIEIDNAVELHLFEVYCAMKLDTARWNTFRTH